MGVLVWFVAAALLAAGETLAGDFFLLMLAGGALAAGGVSLLSGDAYLLQAVVFAIVSIGLVVGARPTLRRRMGVGQIASTGTAALVGKQATVLELTSAHGGQVKLAGEVWTARSMDETVVLEPGRVVTVFEIDGATAVVWAGL